MADSAHDSHVWPTVQLLARLLRAPAARFVAALGITLLGALCAYGAAGGLPLIGIDDANITQVYGKNIAAGHGVVYRPGGERVEGSTPFLWTMITVAAFALPLPPEAVLLILSFLITSLTVFVTLELARLLAGESGGDTEAARCGAFTVTAMMMAAQWSFFGWSVFTLMDVGLWCFLFLLLIYGLARLVAQRKALPISLQAGLPLTATALALTRPEGIAVALGLCGLAWVLLARNRAPDTHRRTVVLALASALAVTLLLTLWRLWYFGFPVPNTYYAKVPSGLGKRLADGLSYLADDFLFYAWGHVILLAIWLFILIRMIFHSRSHNRMRRGQQETGISPALLICLAGIGGILFTYSATGGDHFPLFRFFQPIVPLLALAPVALFALGPRPHSLWPGMALTTLAAILCASIYGTNAHHFRREFDLARDGRTFGAQLSALDGAASLGVVAAGGIARRYDGPIFDLMGLNWVAMAHADRAKTGTIRNHAGFSRAVFWQAEPDLVVLSPRPVDTCPAPLETVPSFSARALKGLHEDERFRAVYTLVLVECRAVFVHDRYRERLFGQDRLAVIAGPPIRAP